MKMKWNLKSVAALLATASLVSPAFANEGPVPKGIPHLDHVFVIMMENHGFNQVVGNPDAPFINSYIKHVNYGTNYFAVAHPSLTNYLEMNGGSNFGVLNDNSPDWHNNTCTPNILSGVTGFDVSSTPAVCPIYGTGTDAATPLIDYSNETSPPAITAVTEIDGVHSYPAGSNISGKMIADQLNAAGKSWKSYEESLPAAGADLVNYSDGFFTNNSNIAAILPQQSPTPTTSNIVQLYAVKHNPFVYFQSIQEAGFGNIVGFEGPGGLFDDLNSGHVPHYSFIAPNQCDDQHGKNNGTLACYGDPNDNGTLVGLNPALIAQGDLTMRTLVNAIHNSPVWQEGNNAIVIIWDENDYSAAPYPNKVLVTVDTNYGPHNVVSKNYYTHFSLLRSIESAFGLPCLNHACDSSTSVMTDLFAGSDNGHDHDGGW
jgi:phosphatidylinositol-3-phosphatase